MAAPYARNMPFAATYWPPGGNDGFGGTVIGPPEDRRCRWQDVAELFRDALGREVTSETIVYVDSPVEIGGFLALGTFLDPAPTEGAREVRQIGISPNLRGTEELHKVYL